MGKILILHDKTLTTKMRGMFETYAMKVGFKPGNFFYQNMRLKVKDGFVKKGKTKWAADKTKQGEFDKSLADIITMINPDAIVVMEAMSLEFLTGQTSIAQTRGSVYYYDNQTLPILIMDDLKKVFTTKQGAFILIADLKKLQRWTDYKQIKQVPFRYKLVQSREDIDYMLSIANKSFVIACDIETSKGLISCVSLTFVKDNHLESFTLAFINPLNDNNTFWLEEMDEMYAWSALKIILGNDSIKVFQNGSYDCMYFLKYNIAVNNFLLDTQILMYSLYMESKKSLGFIASLFLDYYRYWKDEIKGGSDDKDKQERIPKTAAGLQTYWRYCSLDSYYTICVAFHLCHFLSQPAVKWAFDNYNQVFRNQIGPAFYMAAHGFKVNQNRVMIKVNDWQNLHENNLRDLRIMCDDEEFNPNSSDQVCSLIYGILGAKEVGKFGRSADKKVLKLVAYQHPLVKMFCDKIADTKEPLANISKYGKFYPHSRLMYSMNASGTVSTRYSSSQCAFWFGTNAQNIPAEARDILVADEGYILFEFDYSQSDSYFVAYHADEGSFIDNLNSDKDTHCVHAEFFFKEAYEKIKAGYDNGEEWVVHSTKGVRQNTKRITHGAAYMMMGYTLFSTIMGYEATIATAKALGHDDADTWTQRQLINFCQQMLDKYFELYPGIANWQRRIIDDCIKNGKRMTSAFGITRLFFGDIRNDKAIQRQLASQYGQAGTAGNINRTLLEMFYEQELHKKGLEFVTQTHDSITFQAPVQKLDLGIKVLTIMQKPVTIGKHTFSVPVDPQFGFSWKKGMVDFDPNDLEGSLKNAAEKERQLCIRYGEDVPAWILPYCRSVS